MTGIAYLRCSTQEQVTSGLGLESQRERIKAYAAMKGLELGRIIVDEGVSAGKPLASRPGGALLLSALAGRRASAVVVLKLDRAFRNAADCLATVEKWARTGTALHIVDLGGNSIDSTTSIDWADDVDGLFSRWRTDYVPLQARWRGYFPDGRDRRVRPTFNGRRLQSGLVS